MENSFTNRDRKQEWQGHPGMFSLFIDTSLEYSRINNSAKQLCTINCVTIYFHPVREICKHA